MLKEKDILLIDQYLSNQLNPTDSQNFEQRLIVDKLFNQEFKIRQAMSNYVAKKDSIDKGIASIKSIGEEYRINEPNPAVSIPNLAKTKTNRRISIKRILTGVAASVLVGAIYLFQKPIDLYPKNVHHSLLSTQMGNGEDNKIIQQKVIKYYNSADYPKALEALKQYQTEDPKYAMAKAICFLETDQYADAETHFNTIAEQQPIYKDKAYWYLALVDVKQEKYAKALLHIEKIDVNSSFSKKAENLKQNIKSRINN